MVGDIVGGTHEIVEGKNQRAMTRMNDPRRDRKILIAVGLTRPQFASSNHLVRQLEVEDGPQRARRAAALSYNRNPPTKPMLSVDR